MFEGRVETAQAVRAGRSAKLEGAANQKANRTISLIYANQNRNLARSLEFARADFEVRQDVYTYDALAWALYRNKQYAEAKTAMAEALKLGTPEPMFYYHAGVIATAGGRTQEGQAMLRKALALNPNFAFPQADDARRRLAGDSASATNSQIVIH